MAFALAGIHKSEISVDQSSSVILLFLGRPRKSQAVIRGLYLCMPSVKALFIYIKCQ
jgi:hypothetical protein